jgi:hypothetical protein
MMKEMPKAPSARDMKGNQYTGKELVEVFEKPSPTLASAGIDKNLGAPPPRRASRGHRCDKGL